MIYLKLRQEGEPVKHTRVEGLYRQERSQVCRRQRKKKCLEVIGSQPSVVDALCV